MTQQTEEVRREPEAATAEAPAENTEAPAPAEQATEATEAPAPPVVVDTRLSAEIPEFRPQSMLVQSDSTPPSSPPDQPDFAPPSEELTQKIIDQVEFYFSDANIVKDAFLLKHVKRNKEGYVSLKLISSFKRVKHLAKDWQAVAYALRRSKKLEVNEAGTKLRRIDPLPAVDQTGPSRTILATDIPAGLSDVGAVAGLFAPCGDVAQVRLLRPGGPVPPELRAPLGRALERAAAAVVEFTRTEAAHTALGKDWGPVQVTALAAERRRRSRRRDEISSGSEAEFAWRYPRRMSSDSYSSEGSSRSRSGSGASFTSLGRWGCDECRRRGSEGYGSSRSDSCSESGSRRGSLEYWGRERRMSQPDTHVLRFPRGPDPVSRGFLPPLCHTLIE